MTALGSGSSCISNISTSFVSISLIRVSLWLRIADYSVRVGFECVLDNQLKQELIQYVGDYNFDKSIGSMV